MIVAIFQECVWETWSGAAFTTTRVVGSFWIRSHALVCTPNENVPVTRNAKRGETIEHVCERGFLDVTCNMTGTWDANDIGSRDCRGAFLHMGNG